MRKKESLNGKMEGALSKRARDHDSKKATTNFRSQFSLHQLFYFLSPMTLALILQLLPSDCLWCAPGKSEVQKLAEEYTEEEKAKQVAELFSLGDRFFESRDYDHALAAYEQIFIFDPDNRKASAKIDILRKQMKREGKDEIGVVKGVYEEEAKERIRGYWIEVRDYLKKEKLGQARFTLEKILLLDPENSEANKLYEELKQKQSGGKDEAGKAV